MKYTALAGNERIEIDLQSHSLDDVRATVQGRSYRFRLREVEPQVFWVERDGVSIELQVATVDGRYEVRMGRHRLSFEFLDRRAILARGPKRAKSGRNVIRAAMPGKVVRIMVAEGAGVVGDDGLLVLEAMKMQNEIRAAGPGRVERIAVSEGQVVNAGDLLVVLDGGPD